LQADVRRYGLSQILNSESMLDTSAPIPFDFLINGTFLRTTLDEYLTSQGLSSESTVELQYVRSLIPPLFEASFEHDDWVSSVDVLSNSSPSVAWGGSGVASGQERIVSGSYDGLIRIWNKSGQAIITSPPASAGGHTAAVKSAKFISPTQIASAGMDRTVRIWKYQESDDHMSGTLKPTLELYGHEKLIHSIAVHGPSNRILSAGGDGKIGIWSTDAASMPAAASTLLPSALNTKRRKTGTSTSTPQRGPLSLINAHAFPVSAIIFNPLDPTVAYTASEDHSVKTFDLTTSALVDTRTTMHALKSLTALPGISSQLLAAGTMARHITLLDPRVQAKNTQVMTLRGHKNIVTSITPDPESNYGLVSASADGTCRVWDLRSTRQGTKDEGGIVGEPVYVLERQKEKGSQVFDVCWDKDVGIVSAGEDKMVQINRGSGVTRPGEAL
jgi:ribosome biogenesis protein YTM1